MPVLLDDFIKQLWLDPGVPFDHILRCLKNSELLTKSSGLESVKVSDKVEKPKNQGIECVLAENEIEKVKFEKGLG